ncbi:hypothetical protein GCM10010521_46170 [Streptomyces rameus]|uniref:Uncharacterized protein n=1 Tax=Streptomyces rameus TaxID=68261 RepID=A0ABP6NM11_9ACTN
MLLDRWYLKRAAPTTPRGPIGSHGFRTGVRRRGQGREVATSIRDPRGPSWRPDSTARFVTAAGNGRSPRTVGCGRFLF